MKSATTLSTGGPITVWIEPVASGGNARLGAAAPYPLYQEGSPYFTFVVEDAEHAGLQARVKGCWTGAPSARAAARKALGSQHVLIFIHERCPLMYPAAPPEPLKVVTPAAKGHLGGLRGGPARAARLTKAQRSEIAAKAATARWRKQGVPAFAAATSPENAERRSDLVYCRQLVDQLEQLRREECAAIQRGDEKAEVEAAGKLTDLIADMKRMLDVSDARVQRESAPVNGLDGITVIPYEGRDDTQTPRGDHAHDPNFEPYRRTG